MREDKTAIETSVYYANGFLVSYPSNGSIYKEVIAVDVESNWHNERLFKYYDNTITSGEEAERYLLNKGWIRGAYGPNACYADVWIRVGDDILNWYFHQSPSLIYLR